MQRCWDATASSRPHIGELEQSLRAIFQRSASLPQTVGTVPPSDRDGFFGVNGCQSLSAPSYRDTWSILQ